MVCCWEHWASSCLGKALSPGICNRMSHWNGWFSSHRWARRNYSISISIPLSCYKLEVLNFIIPRMGHTSLEEERKWIYHSISCPRFISSHVILLPSSANMYGIATMPSSPKLPTPPRGHMAILLSNVKSFDHHLCSLHWPVGHFSSHGILTEFTYQVLNDSWQSLSLLNSEMFVIRKVVLKIGRPRTNLLPQVARRYQCLYPNRMLHVLT